MKWILILWMESTDSGFPGVQPVLVPQVFETQEECLKAGESNLTAPPQKMWKTVAYQCTPGNAAPDWIQHEKAGA